MEGRVGHPVLIEHTCDCWLDHATPRVAEAMVYAWRKHGPPTKDVVRGALNLCEEAGEVAKEALETSRFAPCHEDSYQGWWKRQIAACEQHKQEMIGELYQVAGYAILLAVQLEGKTRVETK